jgi:hypothetical protein
MGVRTRRFNFKKQAVKQNVKSHTGPKFRADRPSRLHKRAAARAHYVSRAGLLRWRNHGCGCSSCTDAVSAAAGIASVGDGGTARFRPQGAGCDGCSITVAGSTARKSGFTGARLGPLCKPQRSCTQWQWQHLSRLRRWWRCSSDLHTMETALDGCTNARRVHTRTPWARTHAVCTHARHAVVALKQ